MELQYQFPYGLIANWLCESVNFQLINRLQSLIDELDAEHFFLVDDDIEWVLLAFPLSCVQLWMHN